MVLGRGEPQRPLRHVHALGHHVERCGSVELVAHLRVDVNPVAALRPLERGRDAKSAVAVAVTVFFVYGTHTVGVASHSVSVREGEDNFFTRQRAYGKRRARRLKKIKK